MNTYYEVIENARRMEANLAEIAKTRRPTEKETQVARAAYKAAALAQGTIAAANAAGVKRYRIVVTLDSGAERETAHFSDFGDANRWAMEYLRSVNGVGREAWVVTHEGKIAAGYITGPTGAVRVSSRGDL